MAEEKKPKSQLRQIMAYVEAPKKMEELLKSSPDKEFTTMDLAKEAGVNMEMA